MAGELELDGLYSPFQPKPFYDSMTNCSGHSFLQHVKQKNHLWKLAITIKQIGTDICNSVNMILIPIATFCYTRNVFSRSCNFSYSAQAPRS